MTDFTARRAEFRRLHQSGCFLLPNPWNVGTARYLRHLGAMALATTSGGFAFANGVPDADWAVPRDVALAHIAEIVASVELPVNADFESGYAHDPAGVAENVRLCVDTGVAGLSIEDSTGDRDRPLYELPIAVERIQAARAAIDASGSGVLLTARAECYLVGHVQPLQESILRLTAYAAAGADVLFAPGPRRPDEIKAIVDAVAPRPVNHIMSANVGLTLGDLGELGVRRVSVGSALARASWGAFARAAKAMVTGSFAGLDGAMPFLEINAFFAEDYGRRKTP